LPADEVNRALIARWLPPRGLGRVLKTDLFDELNTAGLAPALAKTCDQLIGIDVSRLAGRSVRERTASLRVATADVRHLPFPRHTFDAVVSHSTLDHFASRREIALALREIHRVLCPDGRLVITLDNLHHPLVALRNAVAPHMRRAGALPYELGASHTPRGLAEALAETGFQVIELTAVHHLPRLVSVVVDRLIGAAGRPRWAPRLMRLGNLAEGLSTWPTRFVTGQYVAALARPRQDL
jgi:SAM-dependent methyltransferase